MHGVVSLLDDEHYRLIEEVWEELERDFGVRAVYATPFPHFTYQVSEGYDPKAVESALHRVASETAPFAVRTAGLGIFTSKRPVLYVPVVRSPALERLHGELWRALGGQAAGEAARFYRPEMWMPHVTLAQTDVDCDRLARIVCALAPRNYHWEMEVNNLSYIYDTGTEQGLRCRFNFADRERKDTHDE